MKRWNFILALIVTLIACFACGIKLWLAYDLWAIACYAAIFLALPFASLLHELGHMLFGAIFKIKTVPKFSLFGSSCVRLIPKTDERLRPKLFFTAAGGLAVNLIIIFISSMPLYYSGLPTWLCVFLPSSVYLYILNDVPAKNTDGLVCNNLLYNNDEGKVMVAVLTVQAQVLNGKPIGEVDESLLFDLPQIEEDDQSFIALTELRYEYCKAKGEEERAQAYKDRFDELREAYL
ncbi:MAG: TMEM106 family protein [Clostridia bacterium]|nr:TMEM106 family protein [Clostridia bacterium]